ncbi:microphthalmia-associated transcription factor [Trichonephila inaurata madagascariensis]|uniref:Microphthalmia-associated transcription factor n=1 Tax=Trichonephila inaurata madagascariensis TaxID=2747483 RepID=A0A8X6YVF1_9ARAC|nr:microphthalmia-associated transcription factor [Trichonephila inaurata madagascariensis]
MPSCDVILRTAPSSSQAPPTRSTLLTIRDSQGASKQQRLKRPIIKCIVKVLKRSKSGVQDTGNLVIKKAKEDTGPTVTIVKTPRILRVPPPSQSRSNSALEDMVIPEALFNMDRNDELKVPQASIPADRQVLLKPPTMMSRTALKQQLMREQFRQEEEKERGVACSAPSQTSSAIRVPQYSTPQPVHVPVQVLKVTSKLENPTAYHVQESRQRQLREYLSHSHHNGKASSLPATQIINSVDHSPTSDFSAAISSSATSPADLEEFWNDFQLNSCTDSVADNILDPSLTVPVSTPYEADILEVLSMLPALDGVSTSCPAELTNSTDNEVRLEERVQAFQKDRQKKDNHNRIERRRRFNINDRIKELGTLLPRSNDPYYDLVKDLRQNKGTILKASVDYLRCLKNEVLKIPDLELKLRMMEQVNKKLLLKIHGLELKLKANNIPLSESTWYPSTEADLNAIIKEEILTPPHSNGSNSNDKYFPSSQPSLATLPEHYTDCNIPTSTIHHSLPHSDQNRKRMPIMQFLVKEESQAPSSCSQSPAMHCNTALNILEDLMMEDDQPVTGDPMLSSRNAYTPENMDFMS